MPTVEKTRGGRVYIRPLGQEFEIGDTEDVSAEDAEYLVEERGDFEVVKEDEAVSEDDLVDTLEKATDADDADADEEDVCGYEKDDGSVCQRSPGWGRDNDTGPCKDHVDDAED